MKKVIYNKYGKEEVLEIKDHPLPVINKNQLLLKVKSASINPLDWKLYRGDMKMMSGRKFPKSVGIDFSGIVEETGNNASSFKKGDEVFGLLALFKGGALAEYIVVGEKDIAKKTANISFEQAASLPVTGLSALQIVKQLASVKKGDDVLINGATGGVGMFTLQIAKKQGANITTVTSTKGVALAKKWGADIALDYTQQNIFDYDKQFDVIIDLSDKLPFRSAKKIMKSPAIFVNTAPALKAIVGSFLHNLFSSKKHKILFLKSSREQLNELAELAKGGLDIMVNKSYPLSDVKEAYKEISKNGVMGKAVINVQ